MPAKNPDQFATLRKLIEQGIKRTERFEIATEKNIKELRKSAEEQKKSTEEFKESTEEFKESTKKFEESTEEYKEFTEKNIKNLSKAVSDLNSNWGKFVEALVEPCSLQVFKKRKIDVENSSRRVKRKCKRYGAIEIDVILSNGDVVILIEVKTTLRVDDVKEHVEKRLNRFKSFFPLYKNKKVYGAVAYINVDAEADKYASKNGLFLLTLTGENMIKITNDVKFKPINFNETKKKK